MVDFKYNMDIYISVKVSIGTVMGNQEMLKFVLDHLKTKKMSKYAVKKLTSIRYVPHQYIINNCVIKLF